MNWNIKKKELWEMNKTPMQKAKINFRLWFMKFQRQTHGMGLFMLFILMILTVFMIYNVVTNLTTTQDRQQVTRQLECFIYGGCLQPI